MNKVISSYVLRVLQTSEDQTDLEIRIRLSHVQSDEEQYFTTLDDVKAYLEQQIENEIKLRAENLAK